MIIASSLIHRLYVRLIAPSFDDQSAAVELQTDILVYFCHQFSIKRNDGNKIMQPESNDRIKCSPFFMPTRAESIPRRQYNKLLLY